MSLSQDDLVIVSAARTPFGRFGGSLKDIEAFDLGAVAMREVIARAGVESGLVDEVFWGFGDTSSCKDVFTPVCARQTMIKAGIPPEKTSTTIDKACISASSSIMLGMRTIRAGEAEVILAGGCTSFSQEPFILRKVRWDGYRIGPQTIEDPLFELGYKDYAPVSVDAAEVALEHGVTREMQDAWGARSHKLYGEAHKAGKFKDEMIPMTIKRPRKEDLILEIDEQYRAEMDEAKLAKLPLIYGSKTVTAGNAPGLNDGAAAVLIMKRSKAKDLGLTPLCTLINATSQAVHPRLLAECPAAATNKALATAGLSVSDIDLWEINEAFAAVTLTSGKMLAGEDFAAWDKLSEKVNVNGGAIAIGHANCASGARIVMTAAYELRRRGGGYAVATICGGLAQGDAVIIRVD